MIHEMMTVITIQYAIEIMGFNLIQVRGKHLAPPTIRLYVTQLNRRSGLVIAPRVEVAIE